MSFRIRFFGEVGDLEIWDSFLSSQVLNHTVLNSRRFLSYHSKDKFTDKSIFVYQDESLVALIPAVIEDSDSQITFNSHPGSTFGGILLSNANISLTFLDELISFLLTYFSKEGFNNVIFRLAPSSLILDSSQDMIIYVLRKYGFMANFELGYSINLRAEFNTIESKYTKMRSNNIKRAFKRGLMFRELRFDEIESFYWILISNLKKHGVAPVHSLEELKLILFNKITEESCVYGVFVDSELIAATLILIYNSKTVHCQYFAMNYDYRNLYPMEYLIHQTALTFKNLNYKELSLGIVTENQGGDFNSGLSQFKESFGAEPYNIITMKKRLTQYG